MLMDFCYAAQLYSALLSFWVNFGPELPNLEPDPAFDSLVTSYVLFNQTQLQWKASPGSDGMNFCFLK